MTTVIVCWDWSADLHSILYLNASCGNADRGIKAAAALLTCCSCFPSCVDVVFPKPQFSHIVVVLDIVEITNLTFGVESKPGFAESSINISFVWRVGCDSYI